MFPSCATLRATPGRGGRIVCGWVGAGFVWVGGGIYLLDWIQSHCIRSVDFGVWLGSPPLLRIFLPTAYLCSLIK